MIFGQQRLKRFGFHLIQRDDKEGGDVLSYNGGSKLVPLMTNSGILALQTHEVKVTAEKRSELESTITSALNGDDGVNYCLETKNKNLVPFCISSLLHLILVGLET
jgi:hypothetical protein